MSCIFIDLKLDLWGYDNTVGVLFFTFRKNCQLIYATEWGYTVAKVGELFHHVPQVHFTSLLCWCPCLTGACLRKSDVNSLIRPSFLFEIFHMKIKNPGKQNGVLYGLHSPAYFYLF